MCMLSSFAFATFINVMILFSPISYPDSGGGLIISQLKS